MCDVIILASHPKYNMDFQKGIIRKQYLQKFQFNKNIYIQEIIKRKNVKFKLKKKKEFNSLKISYT